MVYSHALTNVKQLVFEIHLFKMDGTTEYVKDKYETLSKEDYKYYWEALTAVERLGFRKWHYHKNPTWGSRYKSPVTHIERYHLYELYYINTAFMK